MRLGCAGLEKSMFVLPHKQKKKKPFVPMSVRIILMEGEVNEQYTVNR